jgi:hypothetical protein
MNIFQTIKLTDKEIISLINGETVIYLTPEIKVNIKLNCSVVSYELRSYLSHRNKNLAKFEGEFMAQEADNGNNK